MKIEIKIPSSTNGSTTELILRNCDENDSEVLLTISSISGSKDIYILKENLKNTIRKIL